jgi:hypothetical protein
MAVYWNLGAVFDAERDAERFAAFFRGLEAPGPDGGVPLRVHVAEHGPLFLVGVWPLGMSWGSPKGNDPRLTDPERISIVSAWFYDRLREAPPFRLALFGAEAYDMLLDEPVPSFDLVGSRGLVLDEAWFEAWGQPDGVEPFGSGRVWWPAREAVQG